MTADEFELLASEKEVEIETRSSDRTYTTVIWVVEGNGALYIRSWLGDSGAWYQRTLVDPRVALIVGDTRVEFDAVPAADVASVELASKGLRNKYPSSRSLESMLVKEVLHTTMRLDPVS